MKKWRQKVLNLPKNLWQMRQKVIVVNERNDSGYNPGRVEQKSRCIFKELNVAKFCLKR